MTAPNFTTERLSLRPIAEEDIDGMAAMDADPDVIRFIGDGTIPEPVAHRQELTGWIDDSKDPPGMSMWSARALAKHERFLGWVMLYPLPGWEPDVEIGWRFAKAAWGCGYASEAARAIMKHGFENVGLEKIVAVLDPENQRSRNVCERLGMRDAGILRAYDVDCASYVKERGAPE